MARGCLLQCGERRPKGRGPQAVLVSGSPVTSAPQGCDRVRMEEQAGLPGLPGCSLTIRARTGGRQQSWERGGQTLCPSVTLPALLPSLCPSVHPVGHGAPDQSLIPAPAVPGHRSGLVCARQSLQHTYSPGRER